MTQNQKIESVLDFLKKIKNSEKVFFCERQKKTKEEKCQDTLSRLSIS